MFPWLQSVVLNWHFQWCLSGKIQNFNYLRWWVTAWGLHRVSWACGIFFHRRTDSVVVTGNTLFPRIIYHLAKGRKQVWVLLLPKYDANFQQVVNKYAQNCTRSPCHSSITISTWIPGRIPVNIIINGIPSCGFKCYYFSVFSCSFSKAKTTHSFDSPAEAGESQRDTRRLIELDWETPLENQECFQYEDTWGDKERDIGDR